MNSLDELEEVFSSDLAGELFWESAVVRRFLDAVPSDCKEKDVVNYLVKIYANIDPSRQMAALQILIRIDFECAHKIATAEIEASYQRYRTNLGQLHQYNSLICLAAEIGISNSAIEGDKNMRIAHAIINKLDVKEFLARYESQAVDAGHLELVKKLNSANL